MIRILALDVGTVRIGVALSDPLGMTAQPLEVIHRRKIDCFSRIAAIVSENEVQQMVVGLPLTLSGESGLAVESVELFVEELKKHVTIPIEFWDERLTTAEAERAMIAGGSRRNKRKNAIDRIAATLILQSFLDARQTECFSG